MVGNGSFYKPLDALPELMRDLSTRTCVIDLLSTKSAPKQKAFSEAELTARTRVLMKNPFVGFICQGFELVLTLCQSGLVLSNPGRANGQLGVHSDMLETRVVVPEAYEYCVLGLGTIEGGVNHSGVG